MLDYKLLEALGSVIQEQGFDKAAKKLCITQSAVSQRIKTLEEQSGQILVTRTLPPTATSAGQRLVKHYLQVKALEADLRGSSEQKTEGKSTVLAVGVNADSLATWFLPAVTPLLHLENIVLDLKVDDQDQTHKMLRNGEVAGCISSEKSPVQGCRSSFIGTMTYRLAATPQLAETYFLQDLDEERVLKAPAVIFNRKDDLHAIFFKKYYKKPMPRIPAHYIPSSQSFAKMIIEGLAYGMIPDLQGKEHIRSGRLTDLAPKCPVRVNLYWHCWNIKSTLLEQLTRTIVKNAVIC